VVLMKSAPDKQVSAHFHHFLLQVSIDSAEFLANHITFSRFENDRTRGEGFYSRKARSEVRFDETLLGES